MNMNKPPDETLQQGRNRSWLLVNHRQKTSKILSGLIIHDDIIANITTLHERGEQALLTYIYERLVHKTVPIDTPLKAMHFLKLKHADTYVPTNFDGSNKGRFYSHNKKDYNQLIKLADLEIRRTIIVAQQRNLKPLSQFFAFEFSPVPLSLCDTHNIDLFNQQTKAKAIEFLKKIFPSSFSSSCPISTQHSALVIDGGILLEVKPNPETKTIRDYAFQLLEKNILFLFETHDRIDIVFDTSESKKVKQFIKRHEHDADKRTYQLKCNDRLESTFGKFVHSNRAALAECIRQCWMETNFCQRLPLGRLLVVGGPDTTAVKLQNGHSPQLDYLLESNHIEADTRILLHTNAISLDQCYKTVFIKAADTDVILLAIAFGTSIILDHLVVKSTNTRTKKDTFINAKSIATELRYAAIDPTCLLVLHALSGCDTTSFIKNITKEKIFQRFFDDPLRYSSINKLTCISPPYEAIDAAEQLLIRCYSFDHMVHSLVELRGIMADVRTKDRVRTSIASSLPPSTAAFHQHCLRAARQIKIWIDCLDSNPTTPSMVDLGYESADFVSRFKIKWSNLPDRPVDPRLDSCGDCKSNCTRCKCCKNSIPCTFYCKCNVGSCTNQPSVQNIVSFSPNDVFTNDTDDDMSYSTDGSVLGNTNSEQTSVLSESDNIYDQTDDSDIEIENFDRTIDAPDHNYCFINSTTATSQNDLCFHIPHDHNYSVGVIRKLHSSCKRSTLIEKFAKHIIYLITVVSTRTIQVSFVWQIAAHPSYMSSSLIRTMTAYSICAAHQKDNEHHPELRAPLTAQYHVCLIAYTPLQKHNRQQKTPLLPSQSKTRSTHRFRKNFGTKLQPNQNKQ